MKKDKARDIARGVLPSTARKGARDSKREYHATHRSAQRQVNHAIHRSLIALDENGNLYSDPDLFDDFEDLDTFDGYHAATTKPSIGWDGMGEIVSNRRGADKLGPLISWATATEKTKMAGWSVEDKIAYFKAVLPDSLQGRHALGHVESALNLYIDPFYFSYRFNRRIPADKEKFRANLTLCLSSSKGRIALRDHILGVVPVAAHTSEANNKVLSREQARDENGNLRFLDIGVQEFDPTSKRLILVTRPRPYMVDVYVPQIVATTCDDCAFLRTDPLATTDAINRFVDVCWSGRTPHPPYVRRNNNPNISEHGFLRQIFDYIYDVA